MNSFKEQVLSFINKKTTTEEIVKDISTYTETDIDQALLLVKDLEKLIEVVADKCKQRMIDEKITTAGFYIKTKHGRSTFKNIPKLLPILNDKIGVSMEDLVNGGAISLSIPKTKNICATSLMLKQNLSMKSAETQFDTLTKAFVKTDKDIKALERKGAAGE